MGKLPDYFPAIISFVVVVFFLVGKRERKLEKHEEKSD